MFFYLKTEVVLLQGKYKSGDWVVYRMTKQSGSPGKRAKKVVGSKHGEEYRYQVDKYWVVEEQNDEGEVIVRTRRGKKRKISVSDTCLRRANILEKIFLRRRFPKID